MHNRSVSEPPVPDPDPEVTTRTARKREPSKSRAGITTADREPSASPAQAPSAPPLPPTEKDARTNEWLMQFDSAVAMAAAIQQARANGIEVIAVIDALNAVRFRASSEAARAALAAISQNADMVGSNYFVRLPTEIPPVDPSRVVGDQGFEDTVLDFMGVPVDNAALGSGVTIAILDTGIDRSHPTFANASIQSFSLLAEPVAGDPSGHGTAVASLVVGTDKFAPGVAPGARLLDFQVMDAEGIGDAFTIAHGIVQAVDSGAQIISLSLGTYGHSPVLERAVRYAQSYGVTLVAPSGNDGANGMAYPARYPGVIGVAAIDANSRPAYFSNYDDEVDIAAPGVGINAAAPGESWTQFSGTSASTPLVAGSIAGILSSQPHSTSADAARQLIENSNDAGAPGWDPHNGQGILNLGRALQSTPGYDLAIADYYLDLERSTENAISLKITVQNRGTELLRAVRLDYWLEGRQETAFLGNLPVNDVAFHEVLLNPFFVINGSGTRIEAVASHGEDSDNFWENNARAGIVKIGE